MLGPERHILLAGLGEDVGVGMNDFARGAKKERQIEVVERSIGEQRGQVDAAEDVGDDGEGQRRAGRTEQQQSHLSGAQVARGPIADETIDEPEQRAHKQQSVDEQRDAVVDGQRRDQLAEEADGEEEGGGVDPAADVVAYPLRLQSHDWEPGERQQQPQTEPGAVEVDGQETHDAKQQPCGERSTECLPIMLQIGVATDDALGPARQGDEQRQGEQRQHGENGMPGARRFAVGLREVGLDRKSADDALHAAFGLITLVLERGDQVFGVEVPELAIDDVDLVAYGRQVLVDLFLQGAGFPVEVEQTR